MAIKLIKKTQKQNFFHKKKELLTDLSYGPYKSSTETQQGRDDEARVFYVGMTRAKQKLVIVRRTEAQFEYEPIFFHERRSA